jgi:hypothetical protein
MKTCIICREQKEQFSDEHVIADSLGGYYHIYSVCAICNPKLGEKVDSKLVNHVAMEFRRFHLGIRGKKGSLPNPYAGIGHLENDQEQKVKIEFDKNGNLVTRLLPKIPEGKEQLKEGRFRFSLDKKDEHLKEKIIERFLKRHSISKDAIRFQQEEVKTMRPIIQSSMMVDVRAFRIGILKIAYEFTADTLPAYFKEQTAITISQILFNGNIARMEKEIRFLGTGFHKKTLKPFEHLLDFENDNHYLVLIDVSRIGLVCFVNLFDVFSLGIVMTRTPGLLPQGPIVGINDLEKKTFTKLSLAEVVRKTYSPETLDFEFYLPSIDLLRQFIALKSQPDFELYTINGCIPLFDSDGIVRYHNVPEKIFQPHLQQIPLGDTINNIITIIPLDEELFVKLLPGEALYQILSVKVKSHRVGKL